MPLSFVEAPLIRRLLLKQNSCFNFPLAWVLKGGLLPRVARKIKKNCVFPSLASYYIYIVSFDLWMSKVGICDAFVLIVHFLIDKWELVMYLRDVLRLKNPCEMLWFCKWMTCLQNKSSMVMSLHTLNMKEIIFPPWP